MVPRHPLVPVRNELLDRIIDIAGDMPDAPSFAAIREDGSVWMCGYNGGGQAGAPPQDGFVPCGPIPGLSVLWDTPTAG